MIVNIMCRHIINTHTHFYAKVHRKGTTKNNDIAKKRKINLFIYIYMYADKDKLPQVTGRVECWLYKGNKILNIGKYNPKWMSIFGGNPMKLNKWNCNCRSAKRKKEKKCSSKQNRKEKTMILIILRMPTSKCMQKPNKQTKKKHEIVRETGTRIFNLVSTLIAMLYRATKHTFVRSPRLIHCNGKDTQCETDKMIWKPLCCDTNEENNYLAIIRIY